MGKSKGNNAWATLKRLHELVRFLTERGSRGATWDELWDKVYSGGKAKESSRRKMFDRDRDALRDIYDDEDIIEADGEPLEGAAIVTRRSGRYVLQNGATFMLPMKLSEPKALALFSSVRLAQVFIAPFAEAAEALLGMLQKQMSRDVFEKCEALTRAIVPAIPISERVQTKILQDILDAISKKRILDVLRYEAVRERELERCRFSPWLLYLKHHGWYVIGEVHEGGESRPHILRVDRIRIAGVSEEPQPAPCEGEALKELEEKVRLDYDPFKPAPRGGYRVKLRITGPYADACMRTKWFPNEKKELKDGVLMYQVTVWGLEAMALWVMRALECVEVLEPKELRDEIDRRVRIYLARRDGQEN